MGNTFLSIKLLIEGFQKEENYERRPVIPEFLKSWRISTGSLPTIL